ncbi:hypothetical protein F5Y16DRAFT_372103 [Xylariaceae sp. FL0255]|nr:hypothetical protein F5Y16DRAFT_372103 [Xylariaceae sp. FL0255]
MSFFFLSHPLLLFVLLTFQPLNQLQLLITRRARASQYSDNQQRQDREWESPQQVLRFYDTIQLVGGEHARPASSAEGRDRKEREKPKNSDTPDA